MSNTVSECPSAGERPLILVTNDDGITAPGIEALAEELSTLGDVVVMAPDRNRSGFSHAITLHRPLRANQVRPNWWMVDGTPADCVYLGVHELLPRCPQLVVSGVNDGPNISYDVHYSGTVGAAAEGTLMGIPSMAVSLATPYEGSYAVAAKFARQVGERMLTGMFNGSTVVNINVPAGCPTRWQLTFLGHRLYRHSVHRRDDPRGGPYFWIGGVPSEPMLVPGSDCAALADGIISLTPLSVDLSASKKVFTGFDEWGFSSWARVCNVSPPSDSNDVLALER
ncbi:MAG: 5'/3'-nucleotidase SurE [Myxococcales bacterium]|nr:5'/3'-nucleotidase SurE [Myxococcales bacterium]